MKNASLPTNERLAELAGPLTHAFDCYLTNVCLADDAPSLEGPLAFAFAAGYREAFKDVVMELTGDDEFDAYEYTSDPAELIGALLSVVPRDNPSLAAAMYAATGYWTSAVPEGSCGQREPKSLPSKQEA